MLVSVWFLGFFLIQVLALTRGCVMSHLRTSNRHRVYIMCTQLWNFFLSLVAVEKLWKLIPAVHSFFSSSARHKKKSTRCCANDRFNPRLETRQSKDKLSRCSINKWKLFIPSVSKAGPAQPCALAGSWRDAALLRSLRRQKCLVT